jgi:hypothetical protein
MITEVVNVNGKPKPEFFLIAGKSRHSTGGASHRDWREEDKHSTRPVGSE